ncbi:hypothetical protein KAW65_01335 [candidate division WOR-3 bacterium]|nr:hypothetical protein [candidate division WOR-3 bacterium]
MNKKRFLLITGIAILVILTSCHRTQSKKSAVKPKGGGVLLSGEVEPIFLLKNVIDIKAKGNILHYQRESFWKRKDFSRLSKLKEEYRANEINSFRKSLRKYKKGDDNFIVKFNKSGKATILLCDVIGAKQGDWFNFDWFLEPLGLDFIDSYFKSKGRELYWEGEIKGVKTTISIKFPFPINICHKHIWPKQEW